MEQVHIASSATNDAPPAQVLHSTAAHVTKALPCKDHAVWRRAQVINGWTGVHAGCAMSRVKRVLAAADSIVQAAQRRFSKTNTIGRSHL